MADDSNYRMHAYDLERKVRIVGPRLILLATEATNLPRYETIDVNRFSSLLKEDFTENILHILWDQTSYMTTHMIMWTSTT